MGRDSGNMSDREQRQLLAAINRLESLQLDRCMDPFDLQSRPTKGQDEIFQAISEVSCRYVVSSNRAGKTATGARELAWILNRNHPYFDVEAAWGKRPLTILVLGRTNRHLQYSIWEMKLRPFLDLDKFKVVVIGQVIQSITNKENGDVVIFMSHNNVNEARQNAQGYDAQYVWLDEMPDSLSLFTELVTRIVSTGGRLITTFTPLIRNAGIKNMVENCEEPYGKKFMLRMFDNPVNVSKRKEIEAQYKNVPDNERRARMYGEWYLGENAVYNFDIERHVVCPGTYSPEWRHVIGVDPAGSGKAGYVVLAEDPESRIWYVTKAGYIQGDAATVLEREYSKVWAGLNVLKKASDPHESWFIKGARILGSRYVPVPDKSGRKLELINKVQEKLNDGTLKVDPNCDELMEEFTTCRWHETIEHRIIGASRFHVLDSLQYALDILPYVPEEQEILPRRLDMKQRHERRKKLDKMRIENVTRRRDRRAKRVSRRRRFV